MRSIFISLISLLTMLLFPPSRPASPNEEKVLTVRQAHHEKFIHPKVLVIIFNPIIESEGGKKLTEVLGWNNPDTLARNYIADVKECSSSLVEYEIVERIEVDAYPVKLDGFQYDDTTFLKCWRTRKGFHEPDAIDYNKIINQFNIISKVEQDTIDEVWLFAFPYAGCWESTMAGKGAFYCNSDPVPNTENCSRRFIIMGFNYERGVDCMLEDLGHRAESMMSRVFQKFKGSANPWERFALYDKIAPGKANCGNVHFAPNSEKDYDWGNKRYVLSNCDDWYNFPKFKGTVKKVNCEEWGNGDMRAYHLWWFRHIPRVSGKTRGISNNWWTYIIDPNSVR